MICTPMGRSGSIYHIKELPNCYLLAEINVFAIKNRFLSNSDHKTEVQIIFGLGRVAAGGRRLYKYDADNRGSGDRWSTTS